MNGQWMDEWMDGWVDGKWMGGWMGGWMDGGNPVNKINDAFTGLTVLA